MIAEMISSIFLSPLFCDLAAGSDQGNDNSGGSKDGSNYDSGHDFVPLSFLFFRGFSVPRRHPYNTTTRTKIVQVVIFNALFVIFDTGFFQEAAIHIAGLTAPGTSTFSPPARTSPSERTMAHKSLPEPGERSIHHVLPVSSF